MTANEYFAMRRILKRQRNELSRAGWRAGIEAAHAETRELRTLARMRRENGELQVFPMSATPQKQRLVPLSRMISGSAESFFSSLVETL